MNASKEEGRKASHDLEQAAQIVDDLKELTGDGADATLLLARLNNIGRCLVRVQNFIEIVDRELPSEAEIARVRKNIPF